MLTLDHSSPAAGAGTRLRVLGLVGGAVLMLGATGTSQAAITPSHVDPWQHIVDCVHALFENPAEHKQFCEPGPEPVDFKSSFMWTRVTPVPPPPPPVEELPQDFIGN